MIAFVFFLLFANSVSCYCRCDEDTNGVTTLTCTGDISEQSYVICYRAEKMVLYMVDDRNIGERNFTLHMPRLRTTIITLLPYMCGRFCANPVFRGGRLQVITNCICNNGTTSKKIEDENKIAFKAENSRIEEQLEESRRKYLDEQALALKEEERLWRKEQEGILARQTTQGTSPLRPRPYTWSLVTNPQPSRTILEYTTAAATLAQHALSTEPDMEKSVPDRFLRVNVKFAKDLCTIKNDTFLCRMKNSWLYVHQTEQEILAEAATVQPMHNTAIRTSRTLHLSPVDFLPSDVISTMRTTGDSVSGFTTTHNSIDTVHLADEIILYSILTVVVLLSILFILYIIHGRHKARHHDMMELQQSQEGEQGTDKKEARVFICNREIETIV